MPISSIVFPSNGRPAGLRQFTPESANASSAAVIYSPKHPMTPIRSILLVFLIAAAPATKPAAKPTFPSLIREQIKNSLDNLQSNGDFPAAESQLQKTFDQTIAYSLPKDVE